MTLAHSSASRRRHTHRATFPPVLARLADLALRFLTFAILGFTPWWLAVEFFYAR